MKIKEALIHAIQSNKSLNQQNTRYDGKCVYLHGNKLSECTGATLYLCDGTYPSRTTLSRLKAIIEAYKLPINVKFIKGSIYFEYYYVCYVNEITVCI